MKQQVRIIGGIYRGKKLSFPNIPDLRPTTDRIRETLFNWLMHDIRGATCLDAFAGSGALGFEAFSRGAQSVVLVEQAAQVYSHLKTHVTSFASEKLTLFHTDLRAFIEKTANEQFDIIFFDPPFSEPTWYEHPLTEEIRRILRPNGLLYLESPHKIELSETDWQALKSKKAGQVFYSLFKKI